MGASAHKCKHKWKFPSHFRRNALGWRASRLACQRLREAVSEIKAVTREDPVLGAEGAIRLIEKRWPALEHVDRSSGALGSAVSKALDVLVQIVIEAPADEKTRTKWLDRLWDAHQDDGVSYLQALGDRWGEVCGSREVASAWADRLMPLLQRCWADGPGAHFHGITACLSCLLAAGRYQALLDLLEQDRHPWWHYRRYGVQALLRLGKQQEALQCAEASRGLNMPDGQIDRVCEDILLSSGFEQEAYRRYGLSNREGTSYLAWFRAVVKRYPKRDKAEILKDLIASTPGEEGKWFATAKDLQRYDLALELASRSPCEPETLNRAAADHLERNPRFALGAALGSRAWLAEGYGYEVTSVDVHAACDHAIQAAAKLGLVEQVKHDIRRMLAAQTSPAAFVRGALISRLGP